MSIANVAQSTFGVLGRNMAAFLILVVALIAVPTGVIQWLSAVIRADPGLAGRSGLFTILFSIINIVFSFLFQASIVAGAISDLNGRKLDVGGMIAGRVSQVPVLLGLAILQGVAIVVASALLFVPGLILATMWVVTVPSAVIDKTGVLGAFTRSSDLTRGHRWPIFALVMIYSLILIIITLAGTTIFGGFAAMALALSAGPNLGLIVYNVVVGVVFNLIAATGVTVIYYELRRIKEGVAPQALIETFS